MSRLSAVLVALALAVGNAAVCAGWLATPDARMACCAKGGGCPMHTSEARESGAQRVITQAQADSCCAASERGASNESAPTMVPSITCAVLGAMIVLPASVPALVLRDAWRTVAPIAARAIPKHVLLSVFLV